MTKSLPSGWPQTTDIMKAVQKRCDHAERVMKMQHEQLQTDIDIMFEGAPHTQTGADAAYEEYQRVYGIGRKP
jgi:hypothetical protein